MSNPPGYFPAGFFPLGYFPGGEAPEPPPPGGDPGSHFPPGLFPPGFFPPGFFAGGQGEAATTVMTVDEFLSNLYNDELSDLFIGNRNNKMEPRSKLLPIMNVGMLQAYAKYRVVIAAEQLTVIDGVRAYELKTPDVLAITDVTNSYGRSLSFGDEVKILGNILTFPCPKNVVLQVEYKLKPVKFVEDQNDEETPLVLPTLLIPWLSCWVAHRVYKGRKDEGSNAKAAQLLASALDYELVFQQTNTTNEFSSGNSDKLCLKGFA